MKKAILVVDDKKANRFVISEMFKEKYEIIEAEDGIQAIDKVENHYNDIVLIILDIIMPRMNGLEVLEKFKEKNIFKDIPVIVLTEDRSPELEEKIYAYEVLDMLVKPLSLIATKRKISVLLNLYERIKELEK